MSTASTKPGTAKADVPGRVPRAATADPCLES